MKLGVFMLPVNISNLNQDLALLTNLFSKKDSQVRIVGDHLESVKNGNNPATQKQLYEYIRELKYTLEMDQKIYGITDEKADLDKKLSKIFKLITSQYVDNFDKLEDVSSSTPLTLEGGKLDEMTSCIIPIPNDNLFYGFDLIVFKDSYQGQIPLNGIKEKEFKEISNAIHELANFKKNGNNWDGSNTKGLALISPSESSKAIINALCMLCTRQIGRELVNTLINQDKHIFIIAYSSQSGFNLRAPENKDSSPEIQEGIQKIRFIYLNSDQIIEVNTLKGSEEIPIFITLGHEICHALHFLQDPIDLQNDSDEKIAHFHNMEEKRTIIGSKSDGPVRQDEELINRMEEIEKFIKDNSPKVAEHPASEAEISNAKKRLNEEFNKIDESGWDDDTENSLGKNYHWEKLSENGLRSVFNLSPRIDHSGKDQSIKEWLTHQKKLIFSDLEKNKNCIERFTPTFIQRISQTEDWPSFLHEVTKKACEHQCWDVLFDLKKRDVPNFDNTINFYLILFLYKGSKNSDKFLELGADSLLEHMNEDQIEVKFKTCLSKYLESESENTIPEFCILITSFLELFKKNGKRDIFILDIILALFEYNKIDALDSFIRFMLYDELASKENLVKALSNYFNTNPPINNDITKIEILKFAILDEKNKLYSNLIQKEPINADLKLISLNMSALNAVICEAVKRERWDIIPLIKKEGLMSNGFSREIKDAVSQIVIDALNNKKDINTLLETFKTSHFDTSWLSDIQNLSVQERENLSLGYLLEKLKANPKSAYPQVIHYCKNTSDDFIRKSLNILYEQNLWDALFDLFFREEFKSFLTENPEEWAERVSKELENELNKNNDKNSHDLIVKLLTLGADPSLLQGKIVLSAEEMEMIQLDRKFLFESI
jgi:hypothetical protein